MLRRARSLARCHAEPRRVGRGRSRRGSPRWGSRRRGRRPALTGRSPSCSRRPGGGPRGPARGRRGGRGGRRRSRGRAPSRRRAAVDAQQPRAQPGIELVVPGRVQRVGDVEPAAVERELEHLRAAAELAAGVASAAEHAAELQPAGQPRVGRVGDVVLAQVAVQPVGEVQEAVVHRDDEVGDQPRDGERPALLLDARRPRSPGRRCRSRCRGGSATSCSRARRRRSPVGVGIVQPAHLERHQPVLAELERLLDAPLGQVPEVQAAAVAPGGDVVEVEAAARRRWARRTPTTPARSGAAGTRSRSSAAGAGPPFSQRPLTSNVRASSTAKPQAPLPSASPSMLITMLSPGMQWTVCGRVSPVCAHDLVALDHLLDPRPPRVVGDVDDVDPRGAEAGTIRCERSGPWQAELQRFQPKWCSSSPTFGIGVSCTIRPSSASTTARKSGSSTPVPSCRQARYRNSSGGACSASAGEA